MPRLLALARLTPPDPRPDGNLLRAFLHDRDESAFAELVRRHGPVVWGACRRMLPDVADAEDAFQASFLVLVRKADRLTTERTVGPWLYRVAVWTARNLRRKNARRHSRTVPLTDVAADSPREPDIDLDAGLLALPEAYRTPLVLCHLQGLTQREAAERVGCREGTLSARLSRGLVRLRAKLAGRDPLPVFALATAGVVPSALTAATERAGVAFALASLIPNASGPAAALAHGVLRMIWIQKAAGVAVAAMVLLGVAGVTVGVAMRGSERAVGQVPEKKIDDLTSFNDIIAIRKELSRVDTEIEKREKLNEIPVSKELSVLWIRKAKLSQLAAKLQYPIEVLIKDNNLDTLELLPDLKVATLRLKLIEERKGQNHPEVLDMKGTINFLKQKYSKDSTYCIIERSASGDIGLSTISRDQDMVERHLSRLFGDQTTTRYIKFICIKWDGMVHLNLAVQAARRAGYRSATIAIVPNGNIRLTNATPVADRPGEYFVPNLETLIVGPKTDEQE